MRAFFVAFLASLVLSLINVKSLIVDGDTFWAIKVGEWISLNRQFPRYDMFSWTANGNYWVAHEWLYNFLNYKFYTTMGYYGVVFIVFIALFMTFIFLWKLYAAEKRNLTVTLVIYILVVFLLNSFVVARPHVFSYMFFVYFLYVLLRNQKLLWTLPIVTIVWANMHGSVVLGIAMVFLQLLYEITAVFCIEKRFYFNVNLLITSMLVALLSLVNPYGYELWHAAFLQITDSMNRQIVEWQPPNFTNTISLILYLTVIIVTVFVCFIKDKPKDKVTFYLLTIYLLVTFYESITGVRYFPYMAIVWGLFILNIIPDALFSEKQWNKKIIFIISMLAIIILATVGKLPLTIDEAIDKKEWPVEAVNHLEQKRTFNDYMWGGYLIFSDIPVFIDGRADVYWRNSEVFQDYQKANKIKIDPEDVFDKYRVEQVIIPVNKPLDIFLKKVGWAEKYRDETAVIYVKDK